MQNKLQRTIVTLSLLPLVGCAGSPSAPRFDAAEYSSELAAAVPSTPLPVRLVNHEVSGDVAVDPVKDVTTPAVGQLTEVAGTSTIAALVKNHDASWDGGDDDSQSLPAMAPQLDSMELNLPSALAMIDGRHPLVGFAQWRVREAYAQLARAEALWLPSIQAGFSFNRHDGNYQASDGSIVDVNRNSFQYGLGAGAVGAGTTAARPGLIAEFHMADAIFQPKLAQKTAWARGHTSHAVLNRQLLDVAAAYLELIDAHQGLRIVEESSQLTSNLTKLTNDFAIAGQGLQSDADRMRTELELVENRLVAASERTAIASARLAEAISIDPEITILPADITAVPIEMTAPDADKRSLISTGLLTRPELKAAQALVAAACEAYRREKYAPLVPSVLLGFSTGGFGGGLGNTLDNVDSRYDFDALMTWELRNLGFGDRAARCESSARIQQARYDKIRIMDQVAREIAEAHAQVQFRRQQIDITQRAIESAETSYRRNLGRIRDGQGLPLEVLQSTQALEAARRAYLSAVIDFNRAQFQLQWALGWPVTAAASM